MRPACPATRRAQRPGRARFALRARTVEQLRDQYGPPAHAEWGEQQAETYETAWRAWRDLARDVQAAVTAYAKEQGQARHDAEVSVKKQARHAD
jgi:hypothetical protein